MTLDASANKARRAADRFFLISAANIGPNRFHQNRTVSWQGVDRVNWLEPGRGVKVGLNFMNPHFPNEPLI